MQLTTNPLHPDLQEKMERLYRHGFTVVELPDYWVHDSSRPIRWRDDLTNLALDRVGELPTPLNLEEQAPYDEAFAGEVLAVIAKSYPHLINIVDVKRSLACEPSDNALMTALEALSHEKKIEGSPLASRSRKLSTKIEIRLTPLGRDHVKGTAQKPNHMSVIHGDQNINYGNAGAIGRNAVGTIGQHRQWAASENQVDLSQVAAELQLLKTELRRAAKTPSDYLQLALIAEAEQHAEKLDGSKMMEVLSRAGKGLLDFAKDLGVEVTSKVIAKSMGLEP